MKHAHALGVATIVVSILMVADAVGRAQAPPEEPSPDGHERMLAELREIRDGTSLWNPFFRSRKLEQLRRAVTELGDDAPREERLRTRIDLGLEEFRLGSVERALEEFEGLLGEVGDTEKGLRSMLSFHLGLAHLRLGERQNCVTRHAAESCILPIRGGGVHASKTSAQKAIAHFTQALALTPEKTVEHVAIKWLLNIAYMAVGGYPHDVPAGERLNLEVFGPPAAFPRMANVAPAAGLDVVDFAGGAVIEDLDGDGLLDVLTSSWAPATNLRLFRRAVDGSFVEVTSEAGLEGLTGGLNLVHADYDNDGDVDVLVLRGAWLGEYGRHPNSLLQNDGRGRFKDVTFAAGLGHRHSPTQAAAWADFDNDGDLDLYVGNEGSEEVFPAELFRNNGNGTFTEIAREAGVENRRYAKAVVWGDFNGDRFADLYVSNFLGANRLYRNNRDGTFTDVAGDLGVGEPQGSFPSWFWDFDNDGVMDIYSASYPYAQNAGLYNLFLVAASGLGIETKVERSRLYRGNGRGGFESVGPALGLTDVTMPMAANFGDLDNDGFLEFYLGTGYPEYDGLIPNLLYRNVAGGRFENVTIAAGVGHLQKGHGIVFADLDNDGDQDLFAQMGGFFHDDSFANALYENPSSGSNWLKVRLVGTRSNRSAIGARIRAEIEEGSRRRAIFRHVGTGGSFGSDPLIEHLGLGKAQSVRRLEIYWPTSDLTQVFEEVAGAQAIEIVEGETDFRRLPHPRLPLGGDPGSASGHRD